LCSSDKISNGNGQAEHSLEERVIGPDDVQCRIIDNARAGLPQAFSGAGQNLAAAAMLLRTMPEPSTIERRRILANSRIS
jgi:hypothetical protein